MSPTRLGCRVRAFALMLGVAAAACGGGSNAQMHEVAIRGFTYDPATLTAAVGDTVKWTNEDVVPHTATALNQSWNTGGIEPRAKKTVVMTAKGEYRYLCAYHPNMTGKLIVE